jgi:hypothetical protein
MLLWPALPALRNTPVVIAIWLSIELIASVANRHSSQA